MKKSGVKKCLEILPLRGGGVGRLMANAILNFHFDYLHTSLSCLATSWARSNGHLRPLPLRAHPRLLLSVSLHPSFSSGFPASCPRPWRRHHLARGRGDLIHPQRMYNEGHASTQQCLKCCKLNVRDQNRKSCERFIFKGIDFARLFLL